MKKLLSILLAAMLIVACFGMVGCGVSGKYEFYAIEINGEQYKVGDTFNFMGMDITITEEMYADEAFELCKDGTIKDADGEVVEGCTWEKSDKGIDCLFDGEVERSFEKSGRKLIEDCGMGVKMIFKKA